MDPDRFFQVVGDGVRRGHSFELFKTWGNSNLLAGFVRSGTGWGMELSLQGQ